MTDTLPTAVRDGIASGRAALARLPRVTLAALPTPLDACPRLTASLGGPTIMVKRDDCTGLAFGGNKVRQHEYVLGSAVASGADCLVQGSASQSNHSRQLAAAGAKLGLQTFLLPKMDARSTPLQGNFLLDHLLGASIIPIAPDESTIGAKSSLVRRLREEGRNPYVTGMGADDALALAALAYVEALFEIVEQLPTGRTLDWIYTASQGSTQAGLLLGCELLGMPTRVVGVNPMADTHEAYISPSGVLDLARQAASMLGVESRLTAADIVTEVDFVGPGYGEVSDETLEAIRTLATSEGVLLDPVYTGKAFAALLSHTRSGRFTPDETVVFVHTGGLPAIFAYSDELTHQHEGPATPSEPGGTPMKSRKVPTA